MKTIFAEYQDYDFNCNQRSIINQQANNLKSGSIRMAKQTVIITKNETNSISMSIF